MFILTAQSLTLTEIVLELKRVEQIHQLGWIDSKQLDSSGELKPCNAPQCGGFTLEAEFGIPKNSEAEPDFFGWELKQYAVEDFEKIESSKPITLMTPEPTGGFYKDKSPEAFVRKFGYADKRGKVDRRNFGGRHFVGHRCPPTGLTMQLTGFDAATGKITNANGEIAPVSDRGEVRRHGRLVRYWSIGRTSTRRRFMCRRNAARNQNGNMLMATRCGWRKELIRYGCSRRWLAARFIMIRELSWNTLLPIRR
jgi:MvaI/BcnI restriction endonuclease family